MGYSTSPTKRNILTLLHNINSITHIDDSNLTDAVRHLLFYTRSGRYTVYDVTETPSEIVKDLIGYEGVRTTSYIYKISIEVNAPITPSFIYEDSIGYVATETTE